MMKYLVFVLLATGMAINLRAEAGFEKFMAKYGRNYLAEEMAYRQKVYALNMDWAFRMNQQGNSFTLGETPFADMTNTEFRNSQFCGCMNPEKDSHLGFVAETHEFDEEVDWRAKGAVTQVKAQGQCGSCWAFSTVGALESRSFIKTGKLQEFSEQNLVDCAHLCHGCKGGSLGFAFQFVKTDGLCSEEAYPYRAEDGDCRQDQCETIVKIPGFGYTKKYDGDSLKSAIADGPVAVCVDADSAVFQMYKSGVIDTDKCGTDLDHGIVAVAYTKDHVMLKNSWGPDWGDEGYVRIKWEKEGPGICGMNKVNAFPTFD